MSLKVECAAVLAGGKSSRMGREKALLRVENEALIARVIAVLNPIFPQICVITAEEVVALAANREAVSDHFPNRGPLGGIQAALDQFQAPTFIVACDMPHLCGAFIEFLSQNLEGEALVPCGESGAEPLHAVYTPDCLPIFEDFLRAEAKVPSMRRVLSSIDAHFVPVETAREFDPTLRCFSNWNTPEDLIQAPERAET